MCDIVNVIDGLVDEVFEEGETHLVGSKLREIWMTDKGQRAEQFQRDQASNG